MNAYLQSTEVWSGTGSTWTEGATLPTGMDHVCLLTLSSGALFLHAGRGTYTSDNQKTWDRVATVDTWMPGTACAELSQDIWLVHGSATRIFSISSKSWSTGPSISSSPRHGSLVGYANTLLHVGGVGKNEIWQLDTSRTAWTKVIY